MEKISKMPNQLTKNLVQLNADQYLFYGQQIGKHRQIVRIDMNDLNCSYCGNKETCQHIAYIQAKIYKQKKPRVIRL